MWDTFWEFLKVTFLFVLVLGLAYLSTRFLGTRFGGMHARGRHMRILEQVVIGRDRSLLLVEVAGQVHLLGATPDSIRLLSTVDDPLMVEAILQEQLAGPTDRGSLPDRMPESFRSILERFRRQETSDSADSPQQQSAEIQIREQIDRLRRLTKQ